MKAIKNYLFILVVAVLFGTSCKEEQIHGADYNDSTPPQPPTAITYKPLYGGARFFYTLPSDEDLLNIEAVYINSQNESFSFTASYFIDSLDVYGFGDTISYEVQLYAVDRAGNRSQPATVKVNPLEPAISRVVKSLYVKPGFGAFFIDWKNELKQNINIYVDFSYSQGGETKEFTSVFSSNLESDRRFVEDLDLAADEPVNVTVRVTDSYGNSSDPIEEGDITLLQDEKLAKENWFLPAANDSIGGVPQAFGDALEGRLRYLIDDIIDRGDNLNFMHTGSRGRTGKDADGNMPWNVLIDLGDYYELSRIVTVQRHSGGLANVNRGQYYQSENVGLYEMYIWDDDLEDWVYVSQHKIEVPVGLSELEFVKKGEAGDAAYFYPDEPQYTKPTRWFRYRAMKSFNANYTREDANCLSEITLYGKKATQ